MGLRARNARRSRRREEGAFGDFEEFGGGGIGVEAHAGMELVERFEAAQQVQRMDGVLDGPIFSKAPLLGEASDQFGHECEAVLVAALDERSSGVVAGGESDQLADEDLLGGPVAAALFEGGAGGLGRVWDPGGSDDSLQPAASLDIV